MTSGSLVIDFWSAVGNLLDYRTARCTMEKSDGHDSSGFSRTRAFR